MQKFIFIVVILLMQMHKQDNNMNNWADKLLDGEKAAIVTVELHH